jgi:hypothetical protein
MPYQIINTKLIRIALAITFVSLANTTYAINYQDAVTQLGYSELAATFSREKALAISTLPEEEKLSLPELKAAATLQLIGAPIIGLTTDSTALTEFIANYNQPDTAYLLASEGLQARVGFSRKTSAFLYRDDWGMLNQSLIDLGNNRRLVEASEYDLHFEFPTAVDKTQFVAAIDRYAKKNSANQTGLIRSAWWQPFYRSKNATEGFASATQIAVSNGKETALLLALPNQAPALVKAIQQLNPTWSVSPEAIWVNLAFHRYLQGGYK